MKNQWAKNRFPMKIPSSAIEDTFIGHRRYLHRFTKVPSSPYEGIFIKTGVQNG